jgi:gamma-soluble NSF attachment protein
VAHLLRSQQWTDAVAMLLRFAVACQSTGASNSQCKSYLGAIVVWLYAENAKQAWLTYQDALAVDAFISSDEAFAADALLAAYRTGDETAVASTVKSNPVFNYLDNQVARLAKRLPKGDVRTMGPGLGGGMAAAGGDEGREEDLT